MTKPQKISSDPPTWEATDGEYVIRWWQNGQWPKRLSIEHDRPAFSLRVTHLEHGVIYENPQCGSNVGFCKAKAAEQIALNRSELAERQAAVA